MTVIRWKNKDEDREVWVSFASVRPGLINLDTVRGGNGSHASLDVPVAEAVAIRDALTRAIDEAEDYEAEQERRAEDEKVQRLRSIIEAATAETFPEFIARKLVRAGYVVALAPADLTTDNLTALRSSDLGSNPIHTAKRLARAGVRLIPLEDS